MGEQDLQQYNSLPLDPYNPYAFGQGSGYDNRVGLIKELSSTSALIKAINELKGEITDPETGKEIKIIEPIMNGLGISIFFHSVTAAANDINTFSNYRTDEKLIYNLMKKWIADDIYEFYYNRKKYGIKEESHVSIIINKAVGLKLPAFFKALGAGDRRAATASVQEMIQRQYAEKSDFNSPMQQTNRKRGIFSRMMNK